MAEPHVISALVNKRAELAGELFLIDRQRIDVRRRLSNVDRSLKEFGYSSDPNSIPIRRKQGTRLFKNGHLRRMVYDIRRERPELTVTKDFAKEVVRRMGWDGGDAALLDAVSDKVEDVRKAIGRQRR